MKDTVAMAKTWRLNERHYGGLTGLNKAETAEKYGEDQVKIWRRSFDVPPLEMDADHAYYKTIQEDPRYADVPKEELPNCEALKNCIERSLPYWKGTIEPQLREGKKLLIAAHGNSLRGIVKYLEDLTAEQILAIDLPTGIPFYYDLSLPDLKPVGPIQFIGDEAAVAKAMAKVKAQGKKKVETVKVVMTRHGESEWNAKNQFCGWFDAALSDAGKAEAAAGGKAMKDQGFTFDAAHSSVLQRANVTCEIMLDELGLKG